MGISSRPFRFSFGAAERMFIFNGNKEEGEKVRFPVRCVCVCGLWNSFITYDRDRWGPLDARLGTHVRLTVRGFIEALVWQHQILDAPRVS